MSSAVASLLTAPASPAPVEPSAPVPDKVTVDVPLLPFAPPTATTMYAAVVQSSSASSAPTSAASPAAPATAPEWSTVRRRRVMYTVYPVLAEYACDVSVSVPRTSLFPPRD